MYCWPTESNGYSGKDLKTALYPRVYDCSGLVTCSLFDASGIDRRATWNAMRLMKSCAAVTDPKPGDLCFYGSSLSQISHVMIYVGATEKRPKGILQTVRCFGSSGGDRRTITPTIALSMGAKVRGYTSHKYRPDFLCFGRLTTNDQ